MLGKKTGGRQKGTPNKENPLKGYLRTHSLKYFEPKMQVDDDGKTFVASDFEMDINSLAPDDRVMAELKLLKFHTPEMKSVDMDMSVTESAESIIDRLNKLSEETA